MKKIKRTAAYPLRKAKLGLKKRIGVHGEPVILPYRGFGNEKEVVMKCRVVENRKLSRPRFESSITSNLSTMLKRYLSDGIPDIEVQGKLQDETRTFVSDENGFFEARFALDNKQLDRKNWHTISYDFTDSSKSNIDRTPVKGEFLYPYNSCEFGIITDVDDTFLVSHSNETFKKIKLMLIRNAATRVPFDGVAAFYHALQKGAEGQCQNPLFFVSSSEWNLYDLLVDFCLYRNIPKGPFLLRDMENGLRKLLKSGGGSHDHKFEKICSILTTYPKKKFILIGDSGQHDAEIYSEIARQNPNRIKAVYIRDVTPDVRDEEVRAMAKGIADTGVEMLLVQDTVEAAKHAISKGLIKEESLEKIRQDKAANRQKPTENEQFQEMDFTHKQKR